MGIPRTSGFQGSLYLTRALETVFSDFRDLPHPTLDKVHVVILFEVWRFLGFPGIPIHYCLVVELVVELMVE
jgi:hypothetical protein